MPFVEYKENPIEECDIEVEDQMIIDYEENLELDQSKSSSHSNANALFFLKTSWGLITHQ
ncbi:92_t:CDS:2 [Entrophospora sp. SA101]|nr:92_t:CDS:2 [Entrophospora sp. SA101]